LFDGFDIVCIAISRDNLNAWMFFEPLLHGISRSIGQDSDGALPLEIRDQGTIMGPLCIAQSSIPMILDREMTEEPYSVQGVSVSELTEYGCLGRCVRQLHH